MTDLACEKPLPKARTKRLALVAWFACCHRRHTQRKALAQLDDALLRDIGLKPDDVRRECSKPFWR